MRFIFADHDRPAQIQRIRDGIEEFRARSAPDPEHFLMHPVYDALLGQLADHYLGHWKDLLAVVGLGGYGRQEMSPYSDIDLLFLRVEDAPEGIYRGIREILYLLWDAKVEMGHSVRTVDECELEADKDLAVLTSLMDARLIWGDENIFRELLIQRERLIKERHPLDLYLRIESEIRRSCDKFGDTVYLLQPNVKEGPGSLRYMQLIAWLSRIVFGTSSLDELPYLGVCSRKAVQEVNEGLAFLSGVRARLHFLAGRRDDLLTFEAQFALVEQMGFNTTAERRGVENFMREYYRHVSTMDFFGRDVRARARLFLRPAVVKDVKRLKLDNWYYIGAGGVNRYELDSMDADPRDMLNAFRRIAETGCDLDIRVADKIRTLLPSLDNSWMADPQVNTMFLDILRSAGAISKALNAMMKVGFLERFIVEFERVRFLRQHDLYHQYTVDLHTIAVLENLDSFGSSRGDPEDVLLRTIFQKLEKKELLYLAGLFHDVGKGRGAGHELVGEEIARPVLERLGISQEDMDEVCFLIRNHLAMTQIALGKDLHDEALLSRFAETVIQKRRLDMLLILTHADLRAVGPTAFNSWRRHLLEELYFRTLAIIEGEPGGEDLGEWLKEVKALIRDFVPEDFKGPELDQYLAGASSRYLLDFYPSTIVDHFVAMRRHLIQHKRASLSPEDIIMEKTDHPKPGYSAVTIIIQDRPGLFYKIAGTLAANRINILSAWSHSIEPDTAVATFHVNDIPEGALDDPDRWDHFREDMVRVVRGELNVDELVAVRRSVGKLLGTPFKIRFPVRVEIDNAASDRATIVEVQADDRPGLLYDICRKLFSLGLYIVLTKITTEANRAKDVFYVVDENHKKVVDFERLDTIKNSLRDHLTEIEKSLLSNEASVAV
ncbi:MAG: [protein-PII] uridylyltransferase [Thermodesulfobacteriota bacterium]